MFQSSASTKRRLANPTGIQVHNLTVRAKGKLLLENTSVTVAAGRRYGLVGPNGRGKSTLLRLMARRQIPVPLNIDVLLVEQEIVGDERWVRGCGLGRGLGVGGGRSVVRSRLRDDEGTRSPVDMSRCQNIGTASHYQTKYDTSCRNRTYLTECRAPDGYNSCPCWAGAWGVSLLLLTAVRSFVRLAVQDRAAGCG